MTFNAPLYSKKAMNHILRNKTELEKEIAFIARKAGRNPGEVRLIAVSKKQPPEKITAALEAGQRIFGENRVQEAINRWQPLKNKYPDLELHLIGPLQVNKVKDAVALFDFIHVVDREKLACALTKEMRKQGRYPSCLIQVNTGEEEQKHGILPVDTVELLNYCRKECNLDIKGLMCIPPVNEPPSMHFALLNKLAKNHGFRELSMGMSGDYHKAIWLGATLVRIGTAFFGPRV